MPIILTSRHVLALWTTSDGRSVTPFGERTRELLRVNQRRQLEKSQTEPQDIDAPVKAYVGSGMWRIRCRCGEATHTNPEWGVACCFACGATYTNVVFPENYRMIEDLLTKRPVQQFRGWLPHETFDELLAEQIERGDPV